MRLSVLLVGFLAFLTSTANADQYGPLRQCSEILKERAINGCHQCSHDDIAGCTKKNGYVFKAGGSCCTDTGRFDIDGFSYSEYECPSGGSVYCCALTGSSGIPDSRCSVTPKSNDPGAF